MSPRHGDWDERPCECPLCARNAITRLRRVRFDADEGKWLCYWAWHMVGGICGDCLGTLKGGHRSVDMDTCLVVLETDGRWALPASERPPGLREA